MELLAHGGAHQIERAEERVEQCGQRLLKAALALDRVLVERGDEQKRRRLVDGARRLAATI